jgi:hypothetical protein
MATDWAGFWYQDDQENILLKPPCTHEPYDLGFAARMVWCRHCDVYLKLENGKWAMK